MRKITFKSLLLTEPGVKFKVKDLEYDAPTQTCELVKKYVSEKSIEKKGKMVEKLSDIYLENEEFVYRYNLNGTCANGEFEVYSNEKEN